MGIPLDFLRDHQAQLLGDLRDLVAIQSISTDGKHGPELKAATGWAARALGQVGFDVRVFPGEQRRRGAVTDADIVYAEKTTDDPALPTALFYSHVDVQPVEPKKWQSEPFSLVVQDGKAFGRGAFDDKGGFLAQLAVFRAYHALGRQMPVGVKVLVEAMEEAGSPFLVPFLEENRDLLAAGALIITDTDNHAPGCPALTCSLRGCVNVEVVVRSAKFPSHSGKAGGGLADPAMALAVLLSRLHFTGGGYPLRGFYDKVRRLSPGERAMMQALEPEPTSARAQFGVLEGVQLAAKAGEFIERTSRMPAITCIGMSAGSVDNPTNAVFEEARAIVSVRLVPDQVPGETVEQLREVLTTAPPWNVQVEVEVRGEGVPAWMAEPGGKIFETASAALRKGYGTDDVCHLSEGGSIGYVGSAAELLGAVPLLLGITGDHAHSHDEYLDLDDWIKLQASLCHLLEDLKP